MLALVVDDSRTVRLVVGKLLRDVGFDVVEAADGRAALDQLRLHPGVGLVLVDWNMPVMNGLEFVAAVRADRAFDPVRVMMVTTETEPEQVRRALAAGANEYLMKPFNRDVLVAKLGLLGVLEE
ncbi:MAG: response regulator [Gemmataceae bacterium]|nr:response regulator [Gemmataceae bacterium]MBY0513237.1 response regulator [Gemmataceae bacterium]